MTFDLAAAVTALVIPAGSESAELRLIRANDGEVLRALVGGWLQALNVTGDATMFLNEDGKAAGLVDNPVATRLAIAGPGLFPGDYIAGTVVVVGKRPEGEMGEVCADVPQSVLDLCGRAGVSVVGL